MTKIAFLIGKVTNIGGIGRVVSLLSESLIQHSPHEIHIISYLNEKNDGYNWNEEITFHSLLNNPSTMKYGILKAGHRLRKILNKNDIDILVACGSLFGPLGVLSTRFSQKKMIYWDHSNYFENTSHKFKIKSKNFTARFADVVVPLTKTDEKNYKENTAAKKIVQIYNPIDPLLENTQQDYNKDSNYIISVGRLKAQKNFLALVDVAEKVFAKTTNPNLQWHIYGSGPQKEEIQEKIDRMGLTNKVILKGQSNQIYELYPDYALMVMTSRYEGFPMTLLEGVANKLPLVSFDIPTGPNEIIKNGESGFLIQPFDIDDMANKIITLMSDPEKRVEFSEKSEELIQEFKIKSITDNWLSLFSDLTN